jgi:hypothetical protein
MRKETGSRKKRHSWQGKTMEGQREGKEECPGISTGREVSSID